MDLPIECQPENDKEVVKQNQRSQEKVVQSHLSKSVSIDCLGMVHYELSLCIPKLSEYTFGNYLPVES